MTGKQLKEAMRKLKGMQELAELKGAKELFPMLRDFRDKYNLTDRETLNLYGNNKAPKGYRNRLTCYK